MASTRCCVPGCNYTQTSNCCTKLHRFPNPDKDPERYFIWLHSIHGNKLYLDNKSIYNNRRVCRSHFEDKFYFGNKLTANAVPTLNIQDILEGENENYTQDVQEQSMLSVPSPVESNVLNPVADIIIEYVSTETSGQKLSMRQIPRDITTCEVVENLTREPVFSHDIPIGSTLLETDAEEIKINLDIVQNCIKQPRRKYKKKHNGLSWELPSRIPMEHNYSKASKVAATSHLSSNGLHPKKTIRTLKSQNKALRQKLKFYKQKYTDLLRMHQETVPNQIKSKKITKLPQKGQSIRKKAYKNGITYVRLKNFGSGASVPQLSYNFLDSIP